MAGIPNAVKFGQGQKTEGRGRPPALFADAIRRALVQKDPRSKTIALHRIAAAMVREAESGNVQAFKEIIDRIDGKVAQAVQVTGAAGGPIETVVKVEYVRATES